MQDYTLLSSCSRVSTWTLVWGSSSRRPFPCCHHRLSMAWVLFSPKSWLHTRSRVLWWWLCLLEAHVTLLSPGWGRCPWSSSVCAFLQSWLSQWYLHGARWNSSSPKILFFHMDTFWMTSVCKAIAVKWKTWPLLVCTIEQPEPLWKGYGVRFLLYKASNIFLEALAWMEVKKINIGLIFFFFFTKLRGLGWLGLIFYNLRRFHEEDCLWAVQIS